MEQPLLKSLRDFRSIKAQSREEKIQLGGKKGERLEDILQLVRYDAQEMLNTHEQWVEEKMRRVHSYLKDFTDEQIRDIFFSGLEISVTQYARLMKKLHKEFPLALDQEEFRKDLIRSFFMDFVLALRSYKGQELTPSMALDLARLSYRHNPNSLIRLQEQFPDVDPGVIKHAAVNYPTDPKGYIERVSKGEE